MSYRYSAYCFNHICVRTLNIKSHPCRWDLISHMHGWTPVLSLLVMLLLLAVYCCRYAMQRDVYATPSSGDGAGICRSFAFKAIHSKTALLTNVINQTVRNLLREAHLRARHPHRALNLTAVHCRQVKSSNLYSYSAFNNTNCNKATAQY